MSEKIYIIQNSVGHYLGKHHTDELRRWQDGSDNRLLWRSRHRDEATNLVFELSSKDINLRAQFISCEVDARGEPSIKEIGPPVPIPESAMTADEQPALDIEDAPQSPREEAITDTA